MNAKQSLFGMVKKQKTCQKKPDNFLSVVTDLKLL